MAGWLKKLFSSAEGKQTQTLTSDLPPLTDSDFEYLLDQLLQGIAHGWQPDRLEMFIADLGIRGKTPEWEAWLERFSTRILAQTQAQQQRQIGSRLLFVANAFSASPKLQRLAKAFAQIGQQLVTGQQELPTELIWEYDGADRLTSLPEEGSVSQVQTIAMVSPAAEVDPVVTPETTPPPQTPAPAAPTPEVPTPAAESTPELTYTEQLQTLFNRGLAKADQHDFIGAIADWDEVLKMNDQIPQVWHNRGSAFGCLGEFEAAFECFEKALNLAPDSVVVWKDRSYALMKLERWQDALGSWNRTIELRDDVAEAWYQRGYTLERLNKIDNALINYRKAVELAPDFEQARLRLDLLQMGNA